MTETTTPQTTDSKDEEKKEGEELGPGDDSLKLIKDRYKELIDVMESQDRALKKLEQEKYELIQSLIRSQDLNIELREKNLELQKELDHIKSPPKIMGEVVEYLPSGEVMVKNGTGQTFIVNISSDAGLTGSQTLVAYCASKGGVVNMTRAMAVELAPLVRVNCVCPGYVDTDMVRRDGIDKADDPAAEEQALIDFAPLKRIATPEEIAAAILFIASHEARFMTGAALPIDGGASAGH